jgi:K+-transporting ATPase ATPase C chain
MKTLLSHLRGAVLGTLVLAAVTCGLYPLVVWGIAQAAFPHQANGSLIVDTNGTVRGSALLAQGFRSDRYFHPRPSAAGANGYDATSSGGSNLGPTSYRAVNGLKQTDLVPADAVTASASGLDPQISVRNAELQAARVAKARGVAEEKVRELVVRFTDDPGLGILGDAGVRVLELNLALDTLR